MDIDTAVRRVEAEYVRETYDYRPVISPPEGYALILKEMDELWAAVKEDALDRTRMCAQAVQVAVMAIRFLVDIC